MQRAGRGGFLFSHQPFLLAPHFQESLDLAQLSAVLLSTGLDTAEAVETRPPPHTHTHTRARALSLSLCLLLLCASCWVGEGAKMQTPEGLGVLGKARGMLLQQHQRDLEEEARRSRTCAGPWGLRRQCSGLARPLPASSLAPVPWSLLIPPRGTDVEVEPSETCLALTSDQNTQSSPILRVPTVCQSFAHGKNGQNCFLRPRAPAAGLGDLALHLPATCVPGLHIKFPPPGLCSCCPLHLQHSACGLDPTLSLPAGLCLGATPHGGLLMPKPTLFGGLFPCPTHGTFTVLTSSVSRRVEISCLFPHLQYLEQCLLVSSAQHTLAK